MESNLSQILRAVRKMRGMTLERVSILLNGMVTKQALSKYERGLMSPSSVILESLLSVYHIDKSCLHGIVPVKVTTWNFRRMEFFSVKDECKLKSEVVYRLERYLSLEQLLSADVKFKNPLLRRKFIAYEDMEEAATTVRRKWQVGNDVIPSVCRMLEHAGVKVLEMELDDKIDGLCGWANNTIPFIILNINNKTVERKRFTAIHELAHILFPETDRLSENVRERLCHRFASAMLLPQETVELYIGKVRDSLTIQELSLLKTNYGISVAALVHRLKDLSIISDKYYNHIFNDKIRHNIMENGWGGYPLSDEPVHFRTLVNRAIAENLFTYDSFEEELKGHMSTSIENLEII